MIIYNARTAAPDKFRVMGSRTVRAMWLLAVFCTLSPRLTFGTGATTPHPNILWITIEDASPDLGCYGDRLARTPRIDQLAREGARFTRAFSVSGVCAPSRSAIITGMYPTRIGTHHMDDNVVPPAYVKCFTEYLRAAGYYCTNTGKTHYNFPVPLTAWDENRAGADWRGRAPDQPFFSVINFVTTHESRIRDREPGMYAQATQHLRPGDRQDPTQVEVPPYYPDTPVVRKYIARYYDLLQAVDAQVGDVLDRLERDGLRDDTIVFFFSDHGRGLTRAKRWIYDSGIHIPLIVRWPRHIESQTVCRDLVSFVDFAPTTLALCGIAPPPRMDGRIFVGTKSQPPPEHVFAARDRMDETYDIIRAVRDTRFKYIRNFEPEKPYSQVIEYAEKMPTLIEMRRLHRSGKLKGRERNFFLPQKPREELYDTTVDSHEVRNLVGLPDYDKHLERLRTALEHWMQDTADQGFTVESELDERMRPDGKWSTAAAPAVRPPGGRFDHAVDVHVTCDTEGASIAYTTDAGESPHWKLYTTPLKIRQTTRMRFKAVRLGYRDSREVRFEFEVFEVRDEE